MAQILRPKAFSMRLLLLVISAILHFSMSNDLLAGSPQESFRKKTIENLKKERSNLILGRIGLPVIGKNSPSLGTRGNVDRRGDQMMPPILKDGTIRSRHPYSEYRVETGTEISSANNWDLTLTRIREDQAGIRVTSTSTFRFQIGSENNRATCELLWIDFSSSAGDLEGRYSLDRCIDLFDPEKKTRSPSQARISRDCSIGLRYFAETRRD
jgi:hypothetical protein